MEQRPDPRRDLFGSSEDRSCGKVQDRRRASGPDFAFHARCLVKPDTDLRSQASINGITCPGDRKAGGNLSRSANKLSALQRQSATEDTPPDAKGVRGCRSLEAAPEGNLCC